MNFYLTNEHRKYMGLKPIKDNYDLVKYNVNDKSYLMDNFPEYEITLGEEYIKKYDMLTFTVEKGKKNKYLNEFLDLIDVDLSK